MYLYNRLNVQQYLTINNTDKFVYYLLLTIYELRFTTYYYTPVVTLDQNVIFVYTWAL